MAVAKVLQNVVAKAVGATSSEVLRVCSSTAVAVVFMLVTYWFIILHQLVL